MKRTFDLRLSVVSAPRSVREASRVHGRAEKNPTAASPRTTVARTCTNTLAMTGRTLRSKLTGCEKKPKYTSLIRPIWRFIDDENFQKATKLEPHVSSKRSQCDFQRRGGEGGGLFGSWGWVDVWLFFFFFFFLHSAEA